ncbi:MAG: phage holin family protein [Bacteroidaceae bacterium]|jgi:hypothetical protein|nr:phage holin family protein [Bacteroidaceae bacterium]MBR6989299.1 phage holin family protein [Bacteroidaceae bacterium]
MLSSEKNINSLTDLFTDVKEYFLLQKEYVTLDVVEKLTILLSAIALGFVLMCLGLLVLFYLSFTLIYMISPAVGGPTVAFAIMTCIHLVIAAIIYVNRQKLVIAPITKGVASILIGDDNNNSKIENIENETGS